ncbi:MAG: ribonuclease P protein component [Gemmatimonadota bacterium]|nr:ribonuclease P protein component [Gemmatimonadota bacterium]
MENGGRVGEKLPRDARVRQRADIGTLLKRGKRERTSHLDVFFAPSPVLHSRFGLVVPKHGRRIVDRNLLKRRLREIGRKRILGRLDEMGVAVDVLVRARRDAYGVGFGELERELVEWLEAWAGRA